MTQGYGPDHGQQGQQPQWGPGGQNPPPAPQPQQQPQWGSPEQAPPAQPQWGQPSPQSAPQFGPSAGSPAQPQWGQPGEQPQWGQPAPSSMPGGYPGSAGHSGTGTGPQFEPGDGVDWRRVKLLGLILLVGSVLLLLVRLGINLASFIGAEELATSNGGGELGALGIGTGLATIVLFLANLVLSLIMLVLGIMAAVTGRGRARTGGIMVAITIPASVALYWILSIIVAVLLLATGMAETTTGELTGTGYRISAAVDALRALLMVAVIGVGSFFVHSTAAKKLAA